MMPPENAEDVPFLRRREIEDRAKAVLREHGLASIPVDPVVLANRLGIRVNNAKFSDDSMVGIIAKRGDSVTLLVNQGDPPFRKRFTIAHELGHHFLHLLQDGEFVDGEADLFRQHWDESATITPQRRREIQANMFASARTRRPSTGRHDRRRYAVTMPGGIGLRSDRRAGSSSQLRP